MKISLRFFLKSPIYNIPALVQIIAWRRPGNKPLPEPLMDSLPTHICVTRPQWVKQLQISIVFVIIAVQWWCSLYTNSKYWIESVYFLKINLWDHTKVRKVCAPSVSNWLYIFYRNHFFMWQYIDGVMQKGCGHPCCEFQNFTGETKKLFWSVSIKITVIKFKYAIEYDERVLLILIPSA